MFPWNFRGRCFPETERSNVRQYGGGAKVHREPSSNRGLQVRFEIVRLRAIVSPPHDLLVQGRPGALRNGEVLLGTPERPFQTPHQLLFE